MYLYMALVRNNASVELGVEARESEILKHRPFIRLYYNTNITIVLPSHSNAHQYKRRCSKDYAVTIDGAQDSCSLQGYRRDVRMCK